MERDKTVDEVLEELARTPRAPSFLTYPQHLLYAKWPEPVICTSKWAYLRYLLRHFTGI